MYNIFGLISPFKISSPVLGIAITRKCDGLGCGNFGASRDGGSRIHKGLDIKTIKGQFLYAPIGGKVTRFTYNGMNAVLITKGKLVVKVLYMEKVTMLDNVIRGQYIGTSANIKPTYGNSITNHIHLEVIENGVHLDPKKMNPFFL